MFLRSTGARHNVGSRRSKFSCPTSTGLLFDFFSIINAFTGILPGCAMSNPLYHWEAICGRESGTHNFLSFANRVGDWIKGLRDSKIDVVILSNCHSSTSSAQPSSWSESLSSKSSKLISTLSTQEIFSIAIYTHSSSGLSKRYAAAVSFLILAVLRLIDGAVVVVLEMVFDSSYGGSFSSSSVVVVSSSVLSESSSFNKLDCAIE